MLRSCEGRLIVFVGLASHWSRSFFIEFNGILSAAFEAEHHASIDTKSTSF